MISTLISDGFFFLIVAENNSLVFKGDERVVGLLGKVDDAFDNVDRFQSSSTIVAIVTPIGGPPGAVGIVRLSGPKAVEVARRVFRSAKKRRKKARNGSALSDSDSWRPTSHFVEYGVVVDSQGNVVDEVRFEKSCQISVSLTR